MSSLEALSFEFNYDPTKLNINGATIINTSGNTLTITEETTSFNGIVTTTGNLTVGGNLSVTGDYGLSINDIPSGIPLSKIENISTSRIIGRVTEDSGGPEVLTAACAPWPVEIDTQLV